MSDARPAPNEGSPEDRELLALVPMIRKVVGARIRNPHTAEDLVQETLTRVIAARARIEGAALAPYAAVTARNLVATYAAKNDRERNRAHLAADLDIAEPPVDQLLRQEERSLITRALANLPATDRDVLMAHEVEGQDTKTMAALLDSTPGAVAAQLSRARARLRVEYLVAAERVDPPSDRCRPVLRALSLGDRRRQRDLDTDGHLLTCGYCARVSTRLLEQRAAPTPAGEVRVPVARDADVVTARQQGRQTAAEIGFSTIDLTLIATAISEIARNIVKFADHGEIVIAAVTNQHGRQGVRVVARDVGPGIPDAERAMEDGYSTYHGLGLGLPGAKRLMDHLEIASVVGEGTTVTMEKWL